MEVDMSLLHLPGGGRRARRRRLWLALLPLVALVAIVAVNLLPLFVSTAAAQTAPTPCTATPASKADASGTAVGTPEDLCGVTVGGGQTISDDDIGKAKTNEPFAYNLAAYVNQNRLAINIVW